jgi:hypothetical protein
VKARQPKIDAQKKRPKAPAVILRRMSLRYGLSAVILGSEQPREEPPGMPMGGPCMGMPMMQMMMSDPKTRAQMMEIHGHIDEGDGRVDGEACSGVGAKQVTNQAFPNKVLVPKAFASRRL